MKLLAWSLHYEAASMEPLANSNADPWTVTDSVTPNVIQSGRMTQSLIQLFTDFRLLSDQCSLVEIEFKNETPERGTFWKFARGMA